MERDVDFAEEGSLRRLLGAFDSNCRLIEDEFSVVLIPRGDKVKVRGNESGVLAAEAFLRKMSSLLDRHKHVDDSLIGDAVCAFRCDSNVDLGGIFSERIKVRSRGSDIFPKTANQKRYVRLMQASDMVFSIGPAGTGKTYLAMAIAVSFLFSKKVERIVLARPAIEAGERLGFLPGDFREKVMPFLRPLYDALYDMMPISKAAHLVENGTIEIAPLAYMRGRTLNDSFAILDEAQNTTPEQMKMFLTRLGKRSRAVITGDITQIDLPHGQISGLAQACTILANVRGISFAKFSSADVVRHHQVQRIVEAYERHGRGNSMKRAAPGMETARESGIGARASGVDDNAVSVRLEST